MLNEPIRTLILLGCAFYVPAVAALAVPALLLTRRRVRLPLWEILGLALPYALWAGLFFIDSSGKSWGNLNFEPIIVGVGVGLVLAVQCVVMARSGHRDARHVRAAVPVLALQLAWACAVWWAIPTIRGETVDPGGTVPQPPPSAVEMQERGPEDG